MARIVPSLQLAQTGDYIFTPYTYTYSFGRGSRIFFAYSILRAARDLVELLSKMDVCFSRCAREVNF